jgi:biotin carboxylase
VPINCSTSEDTFTLDNKPYLLLLGASRDQVCTLRTARSLGVPVVAVDANPHSPGFAYADEYAVVSTRDVPALKAFADRFQLEGRSIGGVLVQGSDIPQIAAELCEHLGLPSVPFASALIATDKLQMKEHFRAHGIAVPWFQACETLDDLREIVRVHGFPLVIKPVDRSGARGVYLLKSAEQIDALFDASRKESFSGRMIVERFVPGLQISTESIIFSGKVYTVGFADRNYSRMHEFLPSILENGGFVPSICTPAQRAAIDLLIAECAQSLKVENGIIKGDIVIGPQGPMVIEVALRLSGGDFSESLIPLGTGVDIIGAAILMAMRLPLDPASLVPTRDHAVVNQYFFPPPGILQKIEGADAVKALPWVRKLEFWRAPGDRLPAIRCHGDRAGVFIVEAPTRTEAEERASRVSAAIRFHVDQDPVL